jgi:HD superfamily phosphohydrolase
LSLDNNLEAYAEELVKDYDVRYIERKKIIRDAVFGTYELSPLEVNILDLPFVQRLRNIHQTALTLFTYPSATHNRFEHSLGVSIMATKLGNSLNVDQKTMDEIRVAGLLHDIGHGPFSHASEDILKEFPEVCDAFKANSSLFSQEKPHEMIGYKLLQTKAFQTLFEDLFNHYKSDIELQNIRSMIVGKMSRKSEQYKADIINSPFDADKLDYLIRDAHFTGIKMSIDTERMFVTQLIDTRPKKTRRIIWDMGGVHILEQILFNKMLLYPSIYNHHKVRAAVCSIKSLFEIIRDKNFTIDELKFDKVTDFLSVDDCFFLSPKGKPPRLCKQIKKIKERNLLKRALVISKKTVETEDGLDELLKQRDRPQVLRKIAKEIVEDPKLKGKCEYYDVWVDLPDAPRFPEPSQCIVKITDEHYENLDYFLPVAEWSRSFATNKWRGYVFGPSKLQWTLNEVSQKIFKKLFGLKFNDHATILAKISSYAS